MSFGLLPTMKVVTRYKDGRQNAQQRGGARRTASVECDARLNSDANSLAAVRKLADKYYGAGRYTVTELNKVPAGWSRQYVVTLI